MSSPKSPPPLPPLPVADALARHWADGSDSDVWLEGVRGGALAKALADYRAAAARNAGNAMPGIQVVLVTDPEAMESLAAGLAVYGAGPVFEYPAWDILPTETESPDPEIAAGRVAALRALAVPDGAPLVIVPVSALLQPVLSPDLIRAGAYSISVGAEASPGGVTARLVEAGLEPVAQVDAPGQFARRGGILDVWPLLADGPVRIEFFGDVIDTLRRFNPETQGGEAPVEGSIALVEIPRRAFRAAYNAPPAERSSIADHIPSRPDVTVWLRHPAALARAAALYASGFDEDGGQLLSWERLAADLGRHRLAVVAEFDNEEWPRETWRPARPAGSPFAVDAATQGVERFKGGVDAALPELARLIARGDRVRVWCQNEAEQKRLADLFVRHAEVLPTPPELALGRLAEGFTWHPEHAADHDGDDADPVQGMASLSDHELFGREAARRPPARKAAAASPIGDFGQLRDGDYVVHVACGVARYEGIRTLERDGSEQDFMCLLFADDARLYVPLSQVDLVQRYVGSSDARPPLSRLGGGQWEKRKAAVARAVKDIAQDLLSTQAARAVVPGFACPEEDEFSEEFAASFPYDETPDQLSAIEDIKRDQCSARPMDRLLCGDVGFGKTEVALRACYRMAAAGKQSAVLAPTTVLAEQHFRTFTERLSGFPAGVACLSRFRTPEEQKQIVERVKSGAVDILVGTHRLLSKDVEFRDLGLVVVDEEQRFGVEHKERLKSLRASVDVLTMTATPIPRTLHLSLLGLRDISNLTTPPAERHAVRTLVAKWSDELVRRAILRELSRGGQVFFLHNRVKTIDTVAAQLLKLVPEARIAIGHGQMPEGELLRVMTRFLDRKFDVLVCTTIVESGVDIPNVNTLIVDNADHFGLSELHQLRGRVGRRKNQAYAYFLVPKKRPVTDVARKRLQALQEYSELGAGFRLAMRDLEIRGAGNLLGAQQSGHIALVGFDLYCRLLERTVAGLQGRDIDFDPEPVELDLGTRAFVPVEYIPAETQRVEFYRKLSAARDEEALAGYIRYVRDRYGPPPEAVRRCFADQRLRQRAEAAGLVRATRMEGALALTFSSRGEDRAADGIAKLRRKGWRVTPLDGGRWRLQLKPGQDQTSTSRLAVFEEVLAVVSGNSAKPMPALLPDALRVRQGSPTTTSALARSPGDPAKDSVPLRGTAGPVSKAAGKVRPEDRSATSAPQGGAAGPAAKPPAVAQPDTRSTPAAPSTDEGNRLRPPPTRLDVVFAGAVPNRPSGPVKSIVKRRQARELTMLTSSMTFSGGGGGAAAEPVPAAVAEGPGAKILGLEPRAAQGVLVAIVATDELPDMPFGSVTLLLGPAGDGDKHILRCGGSESAERGRWALLLTAGSPERVESIASAYLAAGGARLEVGVS